MILVYIIWASVANGKQNYNLVIQMKHNKNIKNGDLW